MLRPAGEARQDQKWRIGIMSGLFGRIRRYYALRTSHDVVVAYSCQQLQGLRGTLLCGVEGARSGLRGPPDSPSFSQAAQIEDDSVPRRMSPCHAAIPWSRNSVTCGRRTGIRVASVAVDDFRPMHPLSSGPDIQRIGARKTRFYSRDGSTTETVLIPSRRSLPRSRHQGTNPLPNERLGNCSAVDSGRG